MPNANPQDMATATAPAIRQLPLYTADQVFWSCRRAVVVAPHPDDETLGCGGAIALLRQRSIPVQILVISDGTGSHPNSQCYPSERLQNLREQETRLAARRLGVAPQAITFWRWPDTAVPQPGEKNFQIAVDCGRRYFRRHNPTLVFVPWQGDGHRDHRATWEIVQQALPAWPIPRQLAYSIWGSPAAGLSALPLGGNGLAAGYSFR
ncbi:MAG: PIG-L family deacetylase [Leptolyngbyaceae cyanobacterium SM2_3_12]|nr:PIG-L family deacetylase [Leptolyngbyaceae cyanobacterium SM2_3_12]